MKHLDCSLVHLLVRVYWLCAGRSPSKRGVGCQFGPDVTKRFCEQNGLRYVVRSHEVKQDGYEVAHGGKCITVFSAPNYWCVVFDYWAIDYSLLPVCSAFLFFLRLLATQWAIREPSSPSPATIPNQISLATRPSYALILMSAYKCTVHLYSTKIVYSAITEFKYS